MPLLLGGVRDGARQAVLRRRRSSRWRATARPLTDRTGLIATAVCDHPEIGAILEGLAALEFHIALSSIKIDAIEDRILEVLARQGERALAIAPEAGNERLRRFINKKVSDEMLFEKVRLVFARGFTRLKLYLQVGLPSETDDDVADIVRDGRARCTRSRSTRAAVAAASPRSCRRSTRSFRSRTRPYEDESLREEEYLQEKLAFLQRELARIPNVVFRGMPVGEAVWEAFLAKVDESGADILEEAADGVPVRRLLKTHRERIAAVDPARSRVRPPAGPAPVVVHRQALSASATRGTRGSRSESPLGIRILPASCALLAAAAFRALDFAPLTPDPAAFRRGARSSWRSCRPKSIAILRSAPMRTMTNDVEYLYRQDNDFYYLTGILEDDVTAVLRPDAPDGKKYVALSPPPRPAPRGVGRRARRSRRGGRRLRRRRGVPA